MDKNGNALDNERGIIMEMDKSVRKELAHKGSIALLDLNRTLRGSGQQPIMMNADQLIEFQLWLERRGAV